MKKILFAITKSNWGGAQRYVYDLATHATQKGYSSAVLLGGQGALKDKLETAAIPVTSFPFLVRDIHLFKEIASFFQLARAIRKERPDVLHLNSSKIGGLGALAGRVARVQKIVFTAHGWAFNEPRSSLSKLGIQIASWMTIVLCHKVIVLSEKERDQVSKWPWTAKKIVVIPNGVAETPLLERSLARRELLSEEERNLVPEDFLWVGTIAELHKNKGLEYAVEAVSNLKNLPIAYVIIGEGEERAALEALIEKTGSGSRIFLAGYKSDASGLLAAFDIFLFPSVKEGFPYALLEAGRAGLPTIATVVGGIPEVITTMQTGVLVHSRNTKEISLALTHLVEEPERARGFGKALQSRIISQFSIEKMCQKTFDLYA